MDISASLAIAILALVAILPEYAIETVLAWQAGASFDPLVREVTPGMQRVAANVTGSNRLLIGVGWSLVILIFWLRRRRSLDLRGHLSLELGMLVAATLRMPEGLAGAHGEQVPRLFKNRTEVSLSRAG